MRSAARVLGIFRLASALRWSAFLFLSLVTQAHGQSIWACKIGDRNAACQQARLEETIYVVGGRFETNPPITGLNLEAQRIALEDQAKPSAYAELVRQNVTSQWWWCSEFGWQPEPVAYSEQIFASNFRRTEYRRFWFHYGSPISPTTCAGGVVDTARHSDGVWSQHDYTQYCPANWASSKDGLCYSLCPANTEWVASRGGCYRIVDRDFDKPIDSCPARSLGVGNPIYPLTGTKRQEVDLGIRLGEQSLTLSYDSRIRLPGAKWTVAGPPSFGPLWQSSVHKAVALQSNGGPGSAYSAVVLQRGSNVRSTASVAGFDACSGSGGGGSMNYVPTVERSQRIAYSNGAAQVVDTKLLVYEQYNAAGAAFTLQRATGQRLAYVYSDANTPARIAPVVGLLIQINDEWGRAVQFSYEQPGNSTLAPRVRTITDLGGQTVTAQYDGQGNLNRLDWPDGAARIFLYERTDLPWALTGVVDENNRRHATYGYDNEGRALSTEKSGSVDPFAVSYAAGGAPAWSVTETVQGNLICREHRWQAPNGTVLTMPNGRTSAMSAAVVQGMVGLTSQTQPAGSGCAAANSAQGYDAQGNVSFRDDFNGKRACYAYDTSRDLRTVKVEGLPGGTSCSGLTAANAILPVDSRKSSTQWHPDWELSTKQAEPGRITTSVYNGQPDPFNGNALASCAPASAQLPDGKPIAVLCKRVEQATTDANGAAEFAAVLQSGVPARTTTWTYNQYGQVLTENGPRTDVNDTTTYTYYSDTSFTGEGAAAVGHFVGDLATVTNAAGKVTQYTKYNKHGRVLESVDPNGVVTVNTYDLRQRLLSTTVGGQATNYSYDPVGQLKRVTLPDQSWVGYDYDDAHRQMAVYDHKGNRTDYQLDNAGNRIGEQTKDPGGALKRQLSRSIDALGRVQQTTGRE